MKKISIYLSLTALCLVIFSSLSEPMLLGQEAKKKTSPLAQSAPPIVLEEVASFAKQQVTGVTVSRDGRIFVNFPDWGDGHTISVAELVDGQPKPYPDEAWNGKMGAPHQRWICVQSVVADDNGSLWVLDAASPKMMGVIPGGAKLVEFNLATNQIEQTIVFDDTVAPEKSYLNDVRVDTKTGHAFITESGLGALIVVNFKTGKARRLLANHLSTHAEPKAAIVVEGAKIVESETQKRPTFHADGIAYDQKGGWLYYHALTGDTMYRIATAALCDENLSPQELIDKVERLGTTPKPDGMLEGRDGTVYLAAFEQNAIVRFDVATRKSTTVLQDDRLQWPDTLSWGNDGKLYLTTSQIHRMAKYHDGESKQKGAFMVYRFRVP